MGRCALALLEAIHRPDSACRKNFDRHFQESRHSFGMRALGLPNTKHWHEITKIEDAIACACHLCYL
jgi:hypothetical protein